MSLPGHVLERLRKADRVVVTTHHAPDGDAIGSAVGMGLLASILGKPAMVWIPGGFVHAVSRGSTFAPDGLKIHTRPKVPGSADWQPGPGAVLVILDSSRLDRLADADWARSWPGEAVIVLDHHPDCDLATTIPGSLVYCSTEAPSTSALIYRVWEKLVELELPIRAGLTSALADQLYYGLREDSCDFTVCRSGTAHRVAFALVRMGADPRSINGWRPGRHPETLRLAGRFAASLDLRLNDALAIAYLEDVGEAAPRHVEAALELGREPILQLESAQVWVFARPVGDKVRVSLRSRDGARCDVSAVAKRWSGGGHAAAAGFTARVAEVKPVVERIVEVLLELHPPVQQVRRVVLRNHRTGQPRRHQPQPTIESVWPPPVQGAP